MPNQGTTCMDDGIHVARQTGVPTHGVWYEELAENDRQRIVSSFNPLTDTWILEGKSNGKFVYLTFDQETEMEWMRLQDVCGENAIIAFPNPTESKVYFKGLDTHEKYYELHDVMGRIVAVGSLSVTQNAIDLSTFAPGTYRLVLQGYGVISIVKD